MINIVRIRFVYRKPGDEDRIFAANSDDEARNCRCRSMPAKPLSASIALHGERSNGKEVVLATSAQERAVTFSTGAELHAKVIKTARRIAAKDGIALRQSYACTAPKLLQAQCRWRHSRTRGLARKASRLLRTIAGQLVASWSASSPPGTVTQS